MIQQAQDSRGQTVRIGDRVRFRGQEFTVKGFGPKEGRFDTHVVYFEEPVEHTPETPDEISIDLLKGSRDE